MLFATAMLGQASLKGKVIDENGEPVITANVVLNQNGVLKVGGITDFDGNYNINVDPGTYDVVISYIGYPDLVQSGVLVRNGQVTTLDIQLEENTGINLDEVIVREYKNPLIEQDKTTSGQTITSKEIRNLPTKNVGSIAATAAGASSSDEGDAVTIKGSRSNGTDYYIDGIRVRGSGNLIPQSEIDQLQIITGGIEAQYGDVTGGIISITTKGPSAKYSGGVEFETSEYLDDFGYNLISANLSGPILKNDKEQTIIGFRFSGQYLTREDDDPTAINVFAVTDEALAELQSNPITRINRATVASAEFLNEEDVQPLAFQPNERSTRYDITGKIDARINDAIDVTLTGSVNFIEDRFTPGENSRTAANWRLLNSYRNPLENDFQYRGNFRFRHRLGKSGLSSEGDEGAKSSIIRNAQYILQLGYEKREYELGDFDHGLNYFDYGYIGDFGFMWEADIDTVNAELVHVGYERIFTGYTPGTQNPVLANYNQSVDDPLNFNQFVARNGVTTGDTDEAWNFHTNVGTVYNLARKIDNDRTTLNVNSSFDVVPGGSDEGRHSIQFGILYEQRYERDYQINPRRLWVLATQAANRHILGLDTTLIIDSIGGVPIYDNLLDEDAGLGSTFFQRVRDITGQGLNEYVNVNSLTPDQLSLDMFAAQELNDLNLLDYYGYDYAGNRLSNDVTFNDFFTAEENGIRTFPVAAFSPIYSAAFIQDKFQYKDIIFRLGLRVDRYDANTKVLRDPYSLYEIQNAADFYGPQGGGASQSRAPGVEDDYKVYVDGESSNAVTGFRRGDQWYDPQGNPVNSGIVLFGGEVVTPKQTNPEADITDRDFNPDESFQDYEAQINWMPRLAFSFPISDKANFFAHYDILVQRPPSNVVATALDYYYFEQRPGSDAVPFNNPDLKPERTIDYEVGFQQQLGQTSAIKIAAYYKELRDMIQRRTYLFLPSPINSYVTYDNIDFGTVKGFTLQYDLRRTGNVTLQANYTLQFADGTGSDENSQRGISNRGNLRTLFPLNFDERHRIVTTLDYRYGSGKSYNGPRVGGLDILSNFGVNLQTIAVSGRPYTAKLQATEFDGDGTIGQINGARLPWNFTLNLRVDKSFDLVKSSAGKRRLGLNVYLRVQNLLDRRNTVAVYPVTGSATDSGYLKSAIGQSVLSGLETLASNSEGTVFANRDTQFLASYQWRLLNPNFFALPRRIFLGAIFEF